MNDPGLPLGYLVKEMRGDKIENRCAEEWFKTFDLEEVQAVLVGKNNLIVSVNDNAVGGSFHQGEVWFIGANGDFRILKMLLPFQKNWNKNYTKQKRNHKT